jgi:hypothetical protein
VRKEVSLAWRDCAQGGALDLEGLCARKLHWPGGTVRKEAALAWRECAQRGGLGLEGPKETTRSLRLDVRYP